MDTIRAKQKAFINLWIKKDLSQKKIAELLEVTPSMVCKWVAIVKDEYQLIYDTRKALFVKINKTLNDPKATSTDIHNLTTSLSVIDKQFDKLTNTLLFVLRG